MTGSEAEEREEEEAGDETWSEHSCEGPETAPQTAPETGPEDSEVEEPDSDRARETPLLQEEAALTLEPAESPAAVEERAGFYDPTLFFSDDRNFDAYRTRAALFCRDEYGRLLPGLEDNHARITRRKKTGFFEH